MCLLSLGYLFKIIQCISRAFEKEGQSEEKKVKLFKLPRFILLKLCQQNTVVVYLVRFHKLLWEFVFGMLSKDKRKINYDDWFT